MLPSIRYLPAVRRTVLASVSAAAGLHSPLACGLGLSPAAGFHTSPVAASRVGFSGPHDLGGVDGLEPLKAAELSPDVPLHEWELQVAALLTVLARKGLMNVHELRAGIEALPPRVYANAGYYEKWALSAMAALERNGTVTAEEIDAAVGHREGKQWSTQTQEFQVGQDVIIREEDTGVTRWRKPHIRTPGYLFGCPGKVERFAGMWEDPELAAFGMEAPRIPLYRVSVRQQDVWQNAGLSYAGSEQDTVEVEVYQPWLQARPDGWEPVTPHALVDTSLHGASCPTHAHDGFVHVHEERSVVEQVAADREGAEPRYKQWAEGFINLLASKNIVDKDELHRIGARQQETLGKALGPAIVARAWTNPAFAHALRDDAPAAILGEFGVETGNPVAATKLVAHFNTPDVHNVIVCTLCSCYPSAILGLSPAWYKSRSYRARMVRQPRAVLKEFGTHVSEETEVRIHDSTADMRYIVIPDRPAGTEDLTEEGLMRLVNRDSMLGVRAATPP